MHFMRAHDVERFLAVARLERAETRLEQSPQRRAKVAVVEFNRFYVAEGFSPARYAVDFSKAVWLRMKTEPLWTAGAAGAMAAVWQLARARRLPPAAGLAVIWGGAAVLVIVVNGARLFNSYFIQALPPVALLPPEPPLPPVPAVLVESSPPQLTSTVAAPSTNNVPIVTDALLIESSSQKRETSGALRDRVRRMIGRPVQPG